LPLATTTNVIIPVTGTAVEGTGTATMMTIGGSTTDTAGTTVMTTNSDAKKEDGAREVLGRGLSPPRPPLVLRCFDVTDRPRHRGRVSGSGERY